MYAGVLIQTG